LNLGLPPRESKAGHAREENGHPGSSPAEKLQLAKIIEENQLVAWIRESLRAGRNCRQRSPTVVAGMTEDMRRDVTFESDPLGGLTFLATR
jgi:hypothetical protein